MEEKTETSNVKCNICGKETVCEECSKDPNVHKDFQHTCFECYEKRAGELPDPKNTKVCVPPEKIAEAYDRFLSDTINNAFADLWSAEKKKLKSLSKRDIAATCFFEGSRFMLAFMRRASEQPQKNEQKQNEME